MERQLSVSRKLPFDHDSQPSHGVQAGLTALPAEPAAAPKKRRRQQQPSQPSLQDTRQLLSSLGDALTVLQAAPAADTPGTAIAGEDAAPAKKKQRARSSKPAAAPAVTDGEPAAGAAPPEAAGESGVELAKPAAKGRSRAKKQTAAPSSTVEGAATDEQTPAKPKPRRRGKAKAAGSPATTADALLASPSLAAELGGDGAVAIDADAPPAKVKKVRRTKKVIAEEVRAEAMQGIFNGTVLLTGSYSHIAVLGEGTAVPTPASQQQELQLPLQQEAPVAAANGSSASAEQAGPCSLGDPVGAVVDGAAAAADQPGILVNEQELVAHAPPAVVAPVQSGGFVQRLSIYKTPSGALMPNLGYACLCQTLREFDIFNSRDCIKKTFETGGLEAVGALALGNARDLVPLLLWNEAHGIRLFRLSSCIFPWMTFYAMEDLPQWPDIQQALRQAGALATRLGHRLTFHPSEFCKIAGLRADWTAQSIKELEVHSRIFDEMQLLPASPYNKINIHVGGTYGDKSKTLQRFAKVVNERLSPNCRARLTVENDDRPSLFSVADLMELHRLCGIPIVFDFHHHKFLTGDLSEQEALKLALSTWPQGVRPIVHWSESPEDENKPRHAHSEYVDGPIHVCGLEADVDVMIESKAKELALLHYREKAMGCNEAGTKGVDDARAAAVALKRASSDKHRATVKAKAEKRKEERAKGKKAAADDSDDSSTEEEGQEEEEETAAEDKQKASRAPRAAAAKRQRAPAAKQAGKGGRKAKAATPSTSETTESDDADSDFAA